MLILINPLVRRRCVKMREEDALASRVLGKVGFAVAMLKGSSSKRCHRQHPLLIIAVIVEHDKSVCVTTAIPLAALLRDQRTSEHREAVSAVVVVHASHQA
jgi:hypothetical protein